MTDYLKHSDDEEMDIDYTLKELLDRADCWFGILCLAAISGITFDDLLNEEDE